MVDSSRASSPPATVARTSTRCRYRVCRRHANP